MDIPKRKTEKIIILAISIGFIVWSATFIYRSSFIAVDGLRYFSLFDDALISMRYAWNFAHGLGLVWNQGEHIQGYTNLLMTLLMSFAALVFDKSNAVLFIQILGMGFMLAIAEVSMKIADYIFSNENNQRKSFVKVLSFFCALSYYPLIYWSLMGMETGLLTLLMLLGILCAFKYTRYKNPSSLLLVSGYLGLAFLTRNDSIIFAFLIWAYITWETSNSTLKTDRKILRQLLIAISFYFLFVFGQLGFQYLYYGELLPNTYTLKLTGMPLLARIRDGVGFVTPFLRETAFILFLSSMELIFDFRKQKLLLFSIVLSAISYQVYVGGEPWAYWRIMSPTMPLFLVLLISAINAIVHADQAHRPSVSIFSATRFFPRKIFLMSC